MAHIAIVDAEAAEATPLALALGQAGHTTQLIGDGSEALAALRGRVPDAIVLSVELPQVSGYSLCNKIKRDPQLAAATLLLVSSQATAETFEEHKRLRTHADGYGHKPYDIAAVVQTLATLMGAPPQATGAQPAPAAASGAPPPEAASPRAIRFGEDPSVRDISLSPFLQDDAPPNDEPEGVRTAVFGEGELETAAASGHSPDAAGLDDEQRWVEQALHGLQQQEGQSEGPTGASGAATDEPTDPQATAQASQVPPDEPAAFSAGMALAQAPIDTGHEAVADGFPLHTAPFEPTPTPTPTPTPASLRNTPDTPDTPESLEPRDTEMDPPRPKRRRSTGKQALARKEADAHMAALQQRIAQLEQDLARAYAAAPASLAALPDTRLDALAAQVQALGEALGHANLLYEQLRDALAQCRQNGARD